MKNIFLIATGMLLFFSCNSPTGNSSDTTAQKVHKAGNKVIGIDTLLAHPDNYLEKTISIKGLVVHTCKHSGKKMFLAGSDKNEFVKVIAGPGISRFDQSLEGETVVASGIFELLDETNEKHQGEGNHMQKAIENSIPDTTAGNDSTETKRKMYQMICDSFSIFK